MTASEVVVTPVPGGGKAPPRIDDPNPTRRDRVFVGTGMFWGLIVGVLLAVSAIILAAQNTGSVSVSFLGWEFTTPLIALLLLALLVGLVLDELFGLVYRARRRRVMSDREQLANLTRAQSS